MTKIKSYEFIVRINIILIRVYPGWTTTIYQSFYSISLVREEDESAI